MVDARTVKPLDIPHFVKSVKKTGRLVVAEASWKTGGIGGEVVSRVCEEGWQYLKKAPVRVALPDVPAPTSKVLEKGYYESVSVQSVVDAVMNIMK